MLNARKEIISAYRIICKQIDIYITMEGTKNYEDFVRGANEIITELNKSLRLQNKNEKEKGKYNENEDEKVKVENNNE